MDVTPGALCTMLRARTDMFPEFGGDSSAQTIFMTKRASGLATYRNTISSASLMDTDLYLTVSGEKRKSRCEKAKRRRLPAHHVSYDFGGSDFLPSFGGACTLSTIAPGQNLRKRRGTGDSRARATGVSMTLMIFILRLSIQKPAT